MKMPRIIRRRRAVSPILAAILLIGLAVAAGAVLFVVVLPLLSGTADVGFVSAVGADRNSDGLIDQITIQVQNSGSAADTFADGSISLSGWSAAGNIEIGLANPVDLVFKTTDVQAQVLETAEFTITLNFDASPDISLAETDVDMDHSVSLTDSDMLIDFTDGYWYAEAGIAGDTSYSTDTTRSTHTGTRGAQMDHNSHADAIYFRSKAAPTGSQTWQNLNSKANSPETWDVSQNPVLSFWLKIDGGIGPAAGGTDPDIHLCLAVYDGETLESSNQNVIANELEDYASGLQSSDSGWVRIIIDLSNYSDTWPGTTVGNFGIRVIGASNINLAIDDVSIHSALS